MVKYETLLSLLGEPPVRTVIAAGVAGAIAAGSASITFVHYEPWHHEQDHVERSTSTSAGVQYVWSPISVTTSTLLSG